MNLRVLLADDQALVRRGLKMLLDATDDISVVAEAEDGEQVLDQLLKVSVDVLVCDIRMPRLDGLGVVDRLRRGANRLPVVLLTTFHDSDLSNRAADVGANGFLLKDAEPDELRDAIRSAANGGKIFHPVATGGLRMRLPNADNTLIEPPNDRELAILKLMASGMSNRDIAGNLHLAEGTIKNRVSSILTKMDARDRTQAVLKAIRLGLI